MDANKKKWIFLSIYANLSTKSLGKKCKTHEQIETSPSKLQRLPFLFPFFPFWPCLVWLWDPLELLQKPKKRPHLPEFHVVPFSQRHSIGWFSSSKREPSSTPVMKWWEASSRSRWSGNIFLTNNWRFPVFLWGFLQLSWTILRVVTY